MELKDLQKGYKLIKYEDFKVAVSCEVEFEETEYARVAIYSPSTYLLYVAQGSVQIEHEQTTYDFPQGSFCVVRKYTSIHYSQTATADGKYPKTYKFGLVDDFIRRIIFGIHMPRSLPIFSWFAYWPI